MFQVKMSQLIKHWLFCEKAVTVFSKFMNHNKNKVWFIHKNAFKEHGFKKHVFNLFVASDRNCMDFFLQSAFASAERPPLKLLTEHITS